MKRCSECEFIYEDADNLCDMDGHELVFDPKLQSFQNEVTGTTKSPGKTSGKRLTLAAATAALVGVLLVVGYSGLTRENVPQPTKAPSTRVTRAPQSLPQSVPQPLPEALPPSLPHQRPAATTTSPETSTTNSPRPEKTLAMPTTESPIASAAPVSPSPTAVPATVKSEPTKANPKKKSGIVSS